MPDPVVYAVFAAPFVIFTVVLAIVSVWSGQAPRGAAAASAPPPKG